MVSSVPAPLRNSAETYAERAKKAQSSYPLNTLRVEFQATASRSSSSEAPSTSRSSASTSAFPPQIDAFSLRPRLRAPSSSGRTVDARSVDTASEAAVPSNGSRTGAQTSPTASTTLKGPPVNIWAERMKEQKAQAQLHRGEKQQQSSFMPNSPSGSSQSVSSQKASSMASSQAVTNPTVHHTSRAPVPTPGNSVAASKLATSDDHDPFVVRVPPHFSRQSSSNTNPLPVIPAVDLNGWSEVSKSPIGMQRSRDNSHSTASTSDPKGCVDDHSPNHSAVSSTKNDNTSPQHHSHSRSGSAQLSRVRSKNHIETRSQPPDSGSQSRIQSRSGSSASSPRLQMRGRGLPDEGTGVAEPRYGHQRRSSYHRASPGTSDQSGYQSAPYANGSITPLSESSYYRRAPGPPLLDMVRHPPRYAQNFIPPYALLPQYPAGHIPGHTSPHLATGHHSGPSTPPYPHYPPYPVYMFGHPPILWGDILPPAQPNPYFPDHPDISHNHINSSEPLVPQMEFGTQAPMSPVITTEPSASNAQAIELENGQLLGNVEQLSPPLEQAKPPRVVFGTFDVTESRDESSNLPLLTGDDGERRQERTDDVEHAIEQFTAFSIGVGPDEPAPLRHASRKASVRSLSKLQISPPTVPATNGSALVQNSNSSDVTLQSNHESNSALPQQAEGSGIMKPVKWEFGTTLRDDLDDEPRPLSPSPPPSHSDPQNHFNDISVESSSSLAEDPTRKEVSDQLVTVDFLGSASANNDPAVAASLDISPADHSMEKSEEGSISSDVWVVKDYGYGFGDMSGCGNAPDVVQWEMKQRERARIRENYREREMILEQCQRDRERGWVHPGRQLGWRHENGVEDEREVLEQHVDAPRGHMRPRRGSHPGPYVGYGRGGHTGRRGRGFGGGYHVSRHSGGRGGLHHRRPASLPYSPSPFEVIPPPVDIPNGYGHPLHIPSYTPPELDPYQVVPPPPVPAVPVPTPTFPYPMDATRTHLLEQLEYYLSSQNLAQDFFLRQRMDNKGWIPIALLASFKRIQQLTTDMDLVRDVLSMSRVVEVRDDWVRMGGRHWELFVLPNAPKSVVDPGEPPAVQLVTEGPTQVVSQGNGEIGAEGDPEDCDGEEDDDEDIVFVIGEEAEGSWMPEPK